MQYTFEELREVIPHRQIPISLPQSPLSPIDVDAVPIEICLAVLNRKTLKEGALQGERNNSGAKLVRDLIGTENYLLQKGIPFEGNARTLFEQFCERCTPPLDPQETDSIWRSAQKTNPTPCLSLDKIDVCVQAWQRRSRTRKSEQLVPHSQKASATSPGTATAETQERPDTVENRRLRYHRILKELIRIEQIEDLGFQEFERLQLSKREGINSKELQAIKGYQKLNQELFSITVKQLCAEADQDQNWLIEDLIEQGISLLLVSQSKSGKTPLAYDIAYSVVTGHPWLGVFNVPHSGGVLIIQTDESLRASKKNFRSRGLNKLDGVEFTQDFTIKDLPRLKRKIEHLKETINLRLVLIDSLTTINRANVRSENDTEYARDLYNLTSLASDMGITIIITHHRNKGAMKSGLDIISGSHQIPAAVDDIWALHRLSEKDDPTKLKRVLERVASHDGEPFQYVVQLHLEDRSWSLEHEYDPAGTEGERFKEFKEPEERVSTPIQDRVLDFINQSDRVWDYQDLAEEMGINENSIRKALKDLLVIGHIDRHKEEHNGRKRFVYHRLREVSSQIKFAESQAIQEFDNLVLKETDQISSQLGVSGSSNGSNSVLIHSLAEHDTNFDFITQDQNLEWQPKQGLEANLIHASYGETNGDLDLLHLSSSLQPILSTTTQSVIPDGTDRQVSSASTSTPSTGWQPVLGEHVMVYQARKWLPAEVIQLPDLNNLPSGDRARFWKVRLDSGSESYIWEPSNLAPIGSEVC